MDEKKKLRILVGANIKREREKAGFTQEALSEQVSLESKTLSAVERGNVGISLTTLVKLCDVLKVSPNVILCEQSCHNNAAGLVSRLEQLPPEKFAIANQILIQPFHAFDIGDQET